MAVGFIREILHPDWLHRSQQTLPERSVRTTTHWSDSWFNSRICPIILPWLLFRISPDYIKGKRPEQDIFHHSIRCLLLQNHVIWTQKCWCNLPKSYPNMPWWSDWRKCRSIHRWRSGKDKEPGYTNQRLKANFQKPEKMEVETKSKQVCIRSPFRTTTQILGQSSRNRSKRQANSSNNRDGPSSKHQRCTKTNRLHGGTQPFHIKTWRKRVAFL